MPESGQASTREIEGGLSLWDEELKTRAERVSEVREALRDMLEPVLAITESAPSHFRAFASTEAVEVYFAGLIKAVSEVIPVVIQASGERSTPASVMQFFDEVCEVPVDTTRAVLTDLIHSGQILWHHDQRLGLPEAQTV